MASVCVFKRDMALQMTPIHLRQILPDSPSILNAIYGVHLGHESRGCTQICRRSIERKDAKSQTIGSKSFPIISYKCISNNTIIHLSGPPKPEPRKTWQGKNWKSWSKEFFNQATMSIVAFTSSLQSWTSLPSTPRKLGRCKTSSTKWAKASAFLLTVPRGLRGVREAPGFCWF